MRYDRAAHGGKAFRMPTLPELLLGVSLRQFPNGHNVQAVAKNNAERYQLLFSAVCSVEVMRTTTETPKATLANADDILRFMRMLWTEVKWLQC